MIFLFLENIPRINHTYPRIATFCTYLENFEQTQFYKIYALRQIATQELWKKGSGRNDWYDVDDKELRILFVVSLYMEIKRQSNVKNY